jgi:hypothetical protein
MSDHDHVSADEPSKELEEKAKRQPNNEDVKVDLGSDESMDASDPSSAVQPGGDKEEDLPRPHKK